jgi:hypothetical protein
MLQSPALPGFMSMEELKTYIQSEIEKGIEKTLSSKNYVPIEEYNTLKASYIDTVELLASAMKRITQLESGLFLKDSEDEIIRDEYDEPILSPKIELEIIEDADKPLFAPSGKTEKAAVEIVKYAATMKPFNGGKFINNSMLHHFRKNILPEELRPTEKGAREWKKQVIGVVKRIASEAWTDTKKDGNRGTRLGFPKNFNLDRLSVILT